MKEKMYRMNFAKQEFNSLMGYLDLFEDDRLFQKIKKYSTVVEASDGTQCISIRFFGDELQRLCYFLLLAFSGVESEDYFTPLVHEIKAREAAYQGKKEGERQALYEGVKRELLLNPDVTGTAIAQKLNVPKDRVYAIWNQVRADIESTGTSDN